MLEIEWNHSEILGVLEIIGEITGIENWFDWNAEILVFAWIEGKSVNLTEKWDEKSI